MPSYSKSERRIAVVLNYVPFLRPLLKKSYQGLNYLFYGKGIAFNCEYPLKEIGSETSESFFGYYDKSPENKTAQYLIYQETSHSTTNKPDKNKSVDVVLYDKELNKEIIDEELAKNK